MLSLVSTSVFALGLAAAAVTDVRERRIPNVLTVSAVVAALVLAALEGWGSLGAALLGAAAGLAIGVVLFAVGVVGGGDAKLMAVVGAFLGAAALPRALLFIALAGGGLALLTLLAGALLPKPVPAQRGDVRSAGRLSVPYGVAIAAGALATAFLQGGL